jgi:hypothetical protein
MFGKALIAAWIAFLALIFILLAIRKQFGVLPHIYVLKPLLAVLLLSSFVYGIHRLYRQGLKKVRN